jgi:tetratricopeptide (TPR) repeat protein
MFIGRSKNQDEKYKELAQNYAHIANINFVESESLPVVYHAIKSLNLAESGGSMSPARVWSLATVSAIMGTIPNHKLADHYAEKALSAAAAVNEPHSTAWADLAVGTYKLGAGKWDQALKILVEGRELAHQVVDYRNEITILVVMAGLELARGKDLSQSGAYYQQAFDMVKNSGSTLYISWAVFGLALWHGHEGQFEKLLEILKNDSDFSIAPIDRSHLYSTKAYGFWRAGNEQAAVEYCAKCIPLVTSLPAQLYSLLIGERLVANIVFEVWEQGKTYDVAGFRTVAEVRQTASKLVNLMKKFQKVFPFGKTSYLLYQGWLSWMNGNRQSAIREWKASAWAAHDLSMPAYEAHALRELGKHSQGNERMEYLTQALALYRSSNAIYEAENIQKLLEIN